MIKTILQVLAVVVVFVLVYNYFFGTPEEKGNAKEIFQEVKDVGVAVKDLLKSEKEKFDEGKYDNAIQKMRGLFSDLESTAKEVAPEYVEDIQRLEQQRKDLQNQLNDAKQTAADTQEKADKVKEINRNMDDIMKEAERIMQEIKSKTE
jgi:methyl-accepting chemotaxis protein